jgi:hypothetical protein
MHAPRDLRLSLTLAAASKPALSKIISGQKALTKDGHYEKKNVNLVCASRLHLKAGRTLQKE